MQLGDEATCINDSWMYLLWTSDFSPFLTDALGSRMVMCLLPAKHYVVTEDGVNLTLQAVMHVITESWNRLSRIGIPVHDFPSRGAQDMSMCFTDLSSTNGYWSTLYRFVPWRWTPAYASLDGFNTRQIFPDLLHVWHLGVCRDLIGSAMQLLLEAGVWDGRSEATKLQNATIDLKSFAASHKLPLKLKKLSKTKLSLSTKKYPELKSSGYDSYVVLRWLLCVCENRGALIPDRLRTVVGQLFLTSYIGLAHEELRRALGRESIRSSKY
ncbi:hypothetical protein AK812_SmicGene33098 [Symbiodinium microadriaticum]|uniref:Uncharacterized protein n=1 Tax=Symbiodinium microadriaticum TaxID=2951 RepID=A0A1Q9CSI6_SYMMI|nr:hypothetical protein AK812_SmicGene33098 [Symbiodinium microadriaticum]